MSSANPMPPDDPHHDAPEGSARYLEADEAWDAPPATRPDPEAGPRTARLPRAAQARPQRVAPARSGLGHVRGIARRVELRRTDSDTSILSFRVEQYDAAGNRMQPVGVELQLYRGGQLSEGEEVDVVGRWKDGTLDADRIMNLTTGAQVRGVPRWGHRLMMGVAVLFFVGVLGFILLLVTHAI